MIGGTSNFGQITNRPDPDLLRGYNWEYNAIGPAPADRPRVSMTAGFYRRQFYNLDVTDNLNLGVDGLDHVRHHHADRSAAADVRRADHDVQPQRRTRWASPTDNLRTFSDINRTIYNGFEVSANARFSKALLFGGITTERRATECDDSTLRRRATTRTASRFCDAIPPFRTTVKLSGAYQLPYDFQLSGTFLAIARRRASTRTTR